MEYIEVENAFYIKLGQGGEFEKDSLSKGLIRVGWTFIPLEEIINGNWRKIERMIRKFTTNKGAATRDFNMLKNLQQSPKGEIWITFANSKLWWCRMGESLLEQDAKSKFRSTLDGWHDADINGIVLRDDAIPGAIQKYRGFRGTLCHVKETETLNRLINGLQSDHYKSIQNAKANLCEQVRLSLKELHWKEFELLVDLIFSDSGWRRVSKVGESMVFSDIEYEEPVTGYHYQVQVKSSSSLADFQSYASSFSADAYEKLYFVVHSSKQDLKAYQPVEEMIELIQDQRLAEMVVNAGLVDWLLERIR